MLLYILGVELLICMKYITRSIEPLLKKASEQFPALIITGARQCGKSTLVKKVFPKFNYLNLDKLQIKDRALKDPEGFLNDNPSPLIIDEIQEAPDLLSYIKVRIDEKRSKAGQYILTGSQQFSLMEGVQESLAGRAAILDLSTFSIEETKQYLKTEAWEEIIKRGSYPEVFINPKIDRELWYSSYIRTFVERDIAKHLKEDNLLAYERFIRLLAARLSQEINFSKIAKELSVNYKTIQSWLVFLERSQIIFFLQPYFNNLGKRITKSPKLYFYDTDLVANLTGFATPKQVKNGPLAGAFFENLVISEVKKRSMSQSKQTHLYFYKENNGLEVDLIFDDPLKPKLIEIKTSETHKMEFTSNLIKLEELLGTKAEKMIINPSKEETQINGVRFVNFMSL